MGQPVDRSEGVVLVTDYGALDRALAEMARRKEKEEALHAQLRALKLNRDES